MMATAAGLIEVLASIAPGSLEIVQRLQQAKLNNQQILISLLALNLENCKKTQCMIEELRTLKADMTRKGLI